MLPNITVQEYQGKVVNNGQNLVNVVCERPLISSLTKISVSKKYTYSWKAKGMKIKGDIIKNFSTKCDSKEHWSQDMSMEQSLTNLNPTHPSHYLSPLMFNDVSWWFNCTQSFTDLQDIYTLKWRTIWY